MDITGIGTMIALGQQLIGMVTGTSSEITAWQQQRMAIAQQQAAMAAQQQQQCPPPNRLETQLGADGKPVLICILAQP